MGEAAGKLGQSWHTCVLFCHTLPATIQPMSSDPTSTTSKQKKPRSKRAKWLDEFEPNRGDSLFRETDVREEFDWTVGRTEVWWSIPRYTELQDGESDGLDA